MNNNIKKRGRKPNSDKINNSNIEKKKNKNNIVNVSNNISLSINNNEIIFDDEIYFFNVRFITLFNFGEYIPIRF
jgi:hypothetical protein